MGVSGWVGKLLLGVPDPWIPAFAGMASGEKRPVHDRRAGLTLAGLRGRLPAIMGCEKRFEDDLFHLCTHSIRGASRSRA